MKLLLLLQFFFFAIISAQDIRFLKEDITFQIQQEYFIVEGYYWFTNQSSLLDEQLIYFPFGVTDVKETVDSIEIYNILAGMSPRINETGNKGSFFNLNVPYRDTAVIRIKYRQKIISDSVMYILRSTQYWKKPLESAEYKLRIGKQMVMTGFSVQPDKVYSIGNENIYHWKRIDFMPEKDLIFHFRKN